MRFTFGMVGGGGISARHIQGAAKGGNAGLVSGCFSRDGVKNRLFAKQSGVAPDRVYEDYATMAIREAARADRPDFMVVTTPNVSHYPVCKALLQAGFPVMCEKPLAISNPEADELAELAEKMGLLCCTTFTYAGNPYIQLMRALLEEGAIGNLYYMAARYFFGARLQGIMNGQALWRWNPAISGAAGTIGDLGAHLEYLLRMVTGRNIGRVLARLVKKPGGIQLDSTGTALFETTDGVDGTMLVAQLACGYDNDIQIELLGDAGSLRWNFTTPNCLRLEKLAGETIIYRRPGLSHPAMEHFPDWQGMDAANTGFANIYRAYCSALSAQRKGEQPGWFPDFEDGRKGVRFIRACVASHENGSAWVEVHNTKQ